jgi:hypothetical protein
MDSETSAELIERVRKLGLLQDISSWSSWPSRVPPSLSWVGIRCGQLTARPGRARDATSPVIPRCSVAVSIRDADVVIQGDAVRVTEPGAVARIAKAWADPRLAGGARWDRVGHHRPFNAPLQGSPPWNVYRIEPRSAIVVSSAEPGGLTLPLEHITAQSPTGPADPLRRGLPRHPAPDQSSREVPREPQVRGEPVGLMLLHIPAVPRVLEIRHIVRLQPISWPIWASESPSRSRKNRRSCAIQCLKTCPGPDTRWHGLPWRAVRSASTARCRALPRMPRALRISNVSFDCGHS